MNTNSLNASTFSLDSIREFKTELQAVNRYTVVWLAILFFDHLSTFDTEFRHVWNTHPTLYQRLFLLNRYGTLVLVTFAAALTLISIPTQTCEKIMWISPLSGIFVVLVCDTIMSVRIDALYARNRIIRTTLALAVMCEITVMILMSTRLDALILPPIVSILTGFDGCTVTAKRIENAGLITALFWGSPLVVATLFLALTLYRSITEMRGTGRMRLYEKFLSGQVKYFVVVAATHVVNVVLITQRNKPTIQSFNVTASIVLTSISCSRLVLGLYTNVPSPSSGSAGSSLPPPSRRTPGGPTRFDVVVPPPGSSSSDLTTIPTTSCHRVGQQPRLAEVVRPEQPCLPPTGLIRGGGGQHRIRSPQDDDDDEDEGYEDVEEYDEEEPRLGRRRPRTRTRTSMMTRTNGGEDEGEGERVKLQVFATVRGPSSPRPARTSTV